MKYGLFIKWFTVRKGEQTHGFYVCKVERITQIYNDEQRKSVKIMEGCHSICVIFKNRQN